MGELKFFHSLQIKQVHGLTYIHKTKYVKELLKRFKLDKAKSMNTPMHHKMYSSMDIIEYR